MHEENFARENTPHDEYLLHGFEKKYIDPLAKYIPSYIETYHLTLSTIIWNIFILIFSFLARDNVQWLWGVSIMIILQFFTDHFDGHIGRKRKTGLVKWGFYMDHLLDYLFMCCILTGYYMIMNDRSQYLLFFTLAIFGAYMVHSFLSFSITNKFKIAFYRIGPTEMRVAFVVINTLLTVIGTTHMGVTVPFVLVGSFIGLCVLMYQTQKELWTEDMEAKKKGEQKV